MEFRRKLYPRGGSFETTLPKPLLFAVDPSKKYEVVFRYDSTDRSWRVTLEEMGEDVHE